jgi:methionyl-tRNA formyltransferase
VTARHERQAPSSRLARGHSDYDRAAMRTVWVSFDTVGRDCLEAAAEAGAEIVGIVTLPGPVDPSRSGQCRFDDVAERLGAALIETSDINALETLNAIRKLEPELVFVVGWSQLVHDPVIALASEGVYGMHPTLLPRHRGRAPIPWAILSGLARTGVTLFEIVDATADSGAIVGQTVVEIDRDETATTLFDRVAEAHVELIRTHVPLLIAGTAARTAQDSTRASSWPKRVPADGIIDWETRAPYLYDWVRAQTRPYPGAFTFLGEEKVVIWRARPVEVETDEAAGTIVAARPEGPVVACGDGALLLEEIETDAGELSVGVRLG